VQGQARIGRRRQLEARSDAERVEVDVRLDRSVEQDEPVDTRCLELRAAKCGNDVYQGPSLTASGTLTTALTAATRSR
jgi:hypothetical protein